MGQDDIIDRLMSVEREAEQLVNQAQAESDRVLREAEQEERVRHEEAVAKRQRELSKEIDALRQKLESERSEAIEEYRTSLSGRETDRAALYSEIERILEDGRV